MVCPKESPLNVMAEDVANVRAPVWGLPYVCCTDETPLLIEEVATHVGTPLYKASTCPFVPADVVAILEVPLPKSTVFA